MKYCKFLLLFSIFICSLTSFTQTNITELIQYEVDLKSFKNSQSSETQIFNYLEGLFESVKQNKIKVYNAEYNFNKMNLDFKEINSSKKDSLFLFINEYIVAVTPDSNDIFSLFDSLIHVKQNISFKDVVKISFIEKWETDNKGNIIKTVEAFAPVVVIESYFNEEFPLFWVKSSELPDLSFEGNITYSVKIKEKNVPDEFWYLNNILPPNRTRFIQPYIRKIVKGELNEYIIDTLLPKRKIKSIFYSKPFEIFISLEVISDEQKPFTVYEAGICKLINESVVAIAFKEKWTLNSKGFSKQISEYALVFEVIWVKPLENGEHYIYIQYWINPK